ncbi:MAG: hypothetical protein JW757_08185 [Anaerolineales bacterium]|nr:hypothetical protein [Anaerolineales bacterium]
MLKKISFPIVIALLAAGLVTGAASAKARSSGKSGEDLDPNHRMLIGQILEIGAGEFTVEALNGELHILTVTDETVYRTRNGEQPGEASFSDLEIGMYVGVYNHEDSWGGFSARLVVLLPEDFDPNRLKLLRVSGEVSMVTTGGGFFKIETRNGEKLTFTVDEHTRYADGIETLEDLEKGDRVGVIALKQENGDLLVKAVVTQKIQPREFAQTSGRLAEIAGDKITITDRRGLTHTFLLTENTIFKDRAGEVDGTGDLAIGMVLIVVHPRETEANEAKAVLVADEPVLRLKRTNGIIKSINANQLTLDANGQVMHFTIDENTRINGWNVNDLDDLEKDMRILVLYLEDENGKLIARSITGVKRFPGEE